MILPIYLEPQPILRQPTKDIETSEVKDEKIQQLIKDMVETMRNAQGIGLAGPQVGVGKRMTVIDLKELSYRIDMPVTGDALILINPYYKKKTFKKSVMEEGCLSIPVVYGNVKRPESVTIEYLDQHAQPQKLKASGLLARVVQHEVDHLEGILFTDLTKDLSSDQRELPDYPHIP